MLMHVGTPLLRKEGLGVVDYLCGKKAMGKSTLPDLPFLRGGIR
jgi:hypothetical protein